MKATSHPAYRFGDYSLHPATRELRRQDHLFTPSPKVFDCLAYLIEHRDRAVGRDELSAAVWGKVDVADEQVRDLVRKARSQVGNGQAIKTIPRFGFRWIAETIVENTRDEEEVPANSTEFAEPRELLPVGNASFTAVTPSLGALPRTARRFWLRTVHILLLLAGAGTIALLFATRHGTYTSGDGSSEKGALVVLPVKVISTDESAHGWMPLGLMDFIAKDLRGHALTVVPSSDVVILSRDHQGETDLVSRVSTATRTHRLLAPSARQDESGWTVHLELHDDGKTVVAEAHSADVLTAAHEASAHLLQAIGIPARNGDIEPVSGELLQRIEAALLVDDFQAARNLLNSADASIRSTPTFELAAARIDIGLNDLSGARERLVRLLSVVPGEKDPLFRARIFNVLALASRRIGDFKPAVRYASASLELLAGNAEAALSGDAYSIRGVASMLDSNYDKATADFSKARVAFTSAQDFLGLATIDLNEGSLESLRGHHASAIPLFERAVEQFGRLGAAERVAHGTGNEINGLLATMQSAAALEAAHRVSKLVARIEPVPLHQFQFQQARAALQSGRLREAQSLLARIIDTADPDKESGLRSMALGFRAGLELDSGHADAAATQSAEALRGLSASEYVSARGEIWLIEIRAIRAMGQSTQAKEETERFSAWARTRLEPDVAVHLNLAEAEQAWFERQNLAAFSHYDDALRAAHKDGVPAEIAEVVVAYGNALVEAGDLERASAVVGEAARWTATDYDCAVLQARLYRALAQTQAWHMARGQAAVLAGERTLPMDFESSDQ